ncbi:hypothetical protein EYF80_012596 [Liparis tanakae]|uniref:Uncharacterized protein n=1 Tax=Liparis tanakae TaxID=230148 RepID=A0A4Z2IH46_9TELE|nr:hypothetical protein EYF80_012596 [Liparis tanakae]
MEISLQPGESWTFRLREPVPWRQVPQKAKSVSFSPEPEEDKSVVISPVERRMMKTNTSLRLAVSRGSIGNDCAGKQRERNASVKEEHPKECMQPRGLQLWRTGTHAGVSQTGPVNPQPTPTPTPTQTSLRFPTDNKDRTQLLRSKRERGGESK